MPSGWIALIVAGVFEVVWVVGLKYTAGFSRLIPSGITVGAMIASMWLLASAVKTIPIGTAYAIWTGIGAAGAATFGILFFDESRAAGRVACILLIVIGIVGLKLTSPE